MEKRLAFPDKTIQNLFASVRVARRARPSTWHGMELVEFSGWQERAAGACSSRDKERPTLGKAHFRYSGSTNHHGIAFHFYHIHECLCPGCDHILGTVVLQLEIRHSVSDAT
jgi:hypothetical protein